MNRNSLFCYENLTAHVRSRLPHGELLLYEDVLERLKLLCENIDKNNLLNRNGQKILIRQLSDNIINNSLVRNKVLNNPDIHNERIVKPVFIIGLPRTGTSLLHKLMALDRDNRVLKLQDALNPVIPDRAGGRYRKEYAESWLAVMNKTIARTRHMIDISMDSPVECCFLKRNALRCHSISYQVKLDRLEADWLNRKNLSECYKFYRLQLQLIQQPAPAGRWLLKCPSHFPSVEHIFSNFPDAVVICTQRDMSAVVASFTSLISTIRSCLTKALLKESVAAELIENIETQIRMHYEFRRLNPELTITDINYKNLAQDPIGCVQEIYWKNNIPYSGNFEKRMSGWLERNSHEKHGKHIYDLSTFGLNKDIVHKLYHETLEKIGCHNFVKELTDYK